MPDDMSELFAGLGITPPADTGTPPTGTPPAGTEGAASTDQEGSEGQEGQQSSGTEGQQQGQQQEGSATQPGKVGAAFAQMRVENKQLQSVVKSMAQALGIDPKGDTSQLLGALQENLTKMQAKKDGVPEDVMLRLQQLESRDAQYTQEQLKTAAFTGFQKVKDTFALSQVDLDAFADQLLEKGINPFEQDVDLTQQYKLFNYDKLVQAAEEKGRQAEAERAAKANQHGSTPSGTTGKAAGVPEKITTIADLETWGDQQK